jgi:pimeloyl-ACP methyl ester carboxylesterase
VIRSKGAPSRRIQLTHGRVTLALHRLKDGDGRPLLHLHGLGLRAPSSLPEELAAWPGPVYALDFTGHGDSTVPKGGGYTPELLMGDVDAAIEQLGEVTLIGNGLGAYVALLAAGARADAVRGAILCDGPGMNGGGASPGTPQIVRIDPTDPSPPDPFALAELSRDIRPPDYAVDFARLAMEFSGMPDPIAICARARPEWLAAAAEETGATQITLEGALRRYGERR